ncbi:hypothetical protein [Caloranaerobacter azorensis]|uniref:Uncharacterized protein n=1 Tax=Caloranaerobacter azorensis TaxID=116090 RepID=A0A6P1YBQ6_9FIRM|nr:hypothetical protein [Caloranaerobacter azorensis]QIB26278.1 hypothetical protein G3A45_02490 [Caloranaerobacter azorensis]
MLHGGILFLQSFKSGNYREHFNIEEDIEKIDPTDTITVEKILESILDKIEEKNEIELSLLLRAFKITMAKMILENNKDLYSGCL